VAAGLLRWNLWLLIQCRITRIPGRLSINATN
jgi:hypothetical protein